MGPELSNHLKNSLFFDDFTNLPMHGLNYLKCLTYYIAYIVLRQAKF
jgi:hypothetical protein